MSGRFLPLQAGGVLFAVPMDSVRQVRRLNEGTDRGEAAAIDIDEETLPLIDLRAIVRGATPSADPYLVVVTVGREVVCLLADSVRPVREAASYMRLPPLLREANLPYLGVLPPAADGSETTYTLLLDVRAVLRMRRIAPSAEAAPHD